MSDTIRIHGVDVDREEYYGSTLRELIALRVENDNWVDILEGDTWGWNQWFDLMGELLQYGAVSDKAGKAYPDTVTWDAQELRELIGRIERAMFDAVAHIHTPTANMLDYLIDEEYKRRGLLTENEYVEYCFSDYKTIEEWKAAKEEEE